jgi:hypothetical protein
LRNKLGVNTRLDRRPAGDRPRLAGEAEGAKSPYARGYAAAGREPALAADAACDPGGNCEKARPGTAEVSAVIEGMRQVIRRNARGRARPQTALYSRAYCASRMA